jgi:hypothetical protein
MKFLNIIPILLVLASIAPQSSLGVDLVVPPKILKCESTRFLAGLSDFNDSSTYFPVVLEISPEAALLRHSDDTETLGQISLENGIVKLNFSDGDQHSLFEMLEKDLQSLENGTVSEIEGTFEDGYDWNGRYHTRARFQIKCSGNHSSGA